MKRIIFFLVSLVSAYYSYGQHTIGERSFDINSGNLIPSDFDTFWSFKDGCGAPLFYDAHTFMDTFRVLYRHPFSQYLLGKYYCGYIYDIDSISTTCSFIGEQNDSILYIYASMIVTDIYYSPYTKDIYFSPIPDDIKSDVSKNFEIYRWLQSRAIDTISNYKTICIMATKMELQMLTDFHIASREILLRTTEEANADTSNVVFCFQPFLSGYSKELLISQKQVALYKLTRYKRIYYELYRREFTEDLLEENRNLHQINANNY